MAANDNPSPDESFFPEQPETLGRSAAARLRIVSVLLLLLVTSFCSLGGAALAQVSADPDQLIIAPLSPAGEQAGREGLRATRSGDDVSAVKSFSRAIELLGPKQRVTAELYLMRGAALRRLGQLNEAQRDVDEALRLAPDHHVARYARGMVLKSLRRYEQALAAFDSYIAVDPKSPLAHHQRGLALSYLGRPEDAVKSFDVALQLGPDNPSTLYQRAVANTKAGNIGAAIADYARCLKIDPKPIIYYGRGNLYYRKKDYEAALADYSRAIELDPKLVSAYANRGNTNTALGRHAAALADYDAALKLDPTHTNTYRNRGMLYEDQGQLDRARAATNRA